MIKLLLNICLAIFAWISFSWIVFNIEPPTSLTQANFFQLITFFGVFFIVLSSTINLFLKSLISSIIISVGLSLILISKGLNELNWLSAGLVVAAVLLLLSYFGVGNLSKIKSLFNLQKLKRQRFFKH